MENWENLGDKKEPTTRLRQKPVTASVDPGEAAIIAMRKGAKAAVETDLLKILEIRPSAPENQEAEVPTWHLLAPNGTGLAHIYSGAEGWIFQVDSTKTKRSFGETLTLGRRDIPLDSSLVPRVSRGHFTITMESSDQGDRLVIADAGSTNGTWVKVTKSV